MGRKNKNVLGGAASGAAAGTSVSPGWGTAIGGVLGGFLGGLNDSEPQKLGPTFSKEVMDRMYAESIGAAPTAAQLANNAMYEKTLAQQIAAAAVNRGTNPGLAGRNIARIAAEQSQAQAQAAAELAVREKQAALDRYMQAKRVNAGVEQFNLGQEQAANTASNQALGAGLNSLAGAFAQQAAKRDAQGEQNKKVVQQEMNDNYDSSVRGAPSYQFGDSFKNKNVAPDYSLGADLTVVSDERQKELVTKESLPVNNNMQVQNQNANSAPMQMQQQPAPVAPVNSAATGTQSTAAPKTTQLPAPTFQITGEMLQQARKSARGGGNVADIQNATNQLQRGDANISQDQMNYFVSEASRQESRGGKSYRELLNQFIAEKQGLAQQQNEAYDAEQARVNQLNALKNAERTARLNKFYTGQVSPNQNLVASLFQKPQAAPSTEAAALAAGFGGGGSGYGTEQDYLKRAAPFYAGFSISDKNQKEGINKKQENFNPKSFLDKLEAYSYEYKDEAKENLGAPEGRHLGVMAQSLEKAGPVGKSMVKQTDDGTKVVDYGQGFGAILASQAHLNERLSQLEKIYGKKKKD